MYCKPIHLDCEDLIRNFAISEIEKTLDASTPVVKQLQIRHILPEKLKSIIDEELSGYNIPPVRYCLSYVRPRSDRQSIHIDGDHNGIIKSAINIPLRGCENSYQVWYKGNYDTVVIKTLDNVICHKIRWKEPFVEDFRLEITKPHLLRVDRPHSALANETEDRWVFTMRFLDNPSFEDLVKNI
jgi:hypothetical protein